jgi:hypothetical protein
MTVQHRMESHRSRSTICKLSSISSFAARIGEVVGGMESRPSAACSCNPSSFNYVRIEQRIRISGTPTSNQLANTAATTLACTRTTSRKGFAIVMTIEKSHHVFELSACGHLAVGVSLEPTFVVVCHSFEQHVQFNHPPMW